MANDSVEHDLVVEITHHMDEVGLELRGSAEHPE